MTNRKYLNWLYDPVSKPGHIFYNLVEELANRPFDWTVPNDDNRMLDAQLLRDEYGSTIDKDLLFPSDISVLEVMLALARRLEYMTDCDISFWFWRLVDNLGLEEAMREKNPRKFNQIIDILVNRRYGSKGAGSLFPLRFEPEKSQADTEIWYQMMVYLEQEGYN